MKMNRPKLFVAGIVISLLLTSSFAVYASGSDKKKEVAKQEEVKKEQEAVITNYNSFSGKVTEIENRVANLTHIHVEHSEGKIAQLVISGDTQILEGKTITVGAWVTGFYNADMPMIMIYPPQYSVDILIVDSEENAEYVPFIGTVKTITESTTIKGTKTVYVEGTDGLEANIVITKDTHLVQNKDVKVGAVITAYYNKNAPTIMIYPPNYSAKVVVINKDKVEEEVVEPEVKLGSFTGKVTKIENPSTKIQHISVKNAEGATAVFVITKDTYINSNKKIKVGSNITGYYNANAPMIMIYPPQYSIDILIVDPEEGAEYVPFKGTVKTITESTSIKGMKTVYVIGEDGLEANIVITKETHIAQNKDVKVGAVITAYYNKNAPSITIYPPNYSAKLVVVNQDSTEVEEIVEPEAKLGSFTGKVTKIKNYSTKIKHVSVKNADGTTAVFVITKDTYIYNNKKIKVGSKITGYYNVNAPMIMIYPPQYSMDLIVVSPKKHVNYQSITGTVKKITNSKTVKGQKTVYIENEKGSANVVVTKNTILGKADKIKVGTVIKAYYDGDVSSIAIYPPNYTGKIVNVIKSPETKTKKNK